MSIVICAIQNNKEFVIAADKRAITNGVVRDDYNKILQLRPGIFYGMTGSAELGQRFFDIMLKPKSNFNSKDILSFVDKEFTPMPQKLTMTIAGRDEEHNFIIWQKNNGGIIYHPQVREDLLVCSFASNENTSLWEDYFLMQRQFVPLEEAVVLTIRYAAENDRDRTISREYDLYRMSRAADIED
jgi:hypothetical protein